VFGRVDLGFGKQDQFEQRRPVMVAWEHVPGATVHTGLFNEYQLPNGRKTFLYYSTSMLEETPVELLPPPPSPDTLSAALQASVPMLTRFAARASVSLRRLHCVEPSAFFRAGCFVPFGVTTVPSRIHFVSPFARTGAKEYDPVVTRSTRVRML